MRMLLYASRALACIAGEFTDDVSDVIDMPQVGH